MLNILERRWARRAHALVADADHIDETSRLGGSPDFDELDGPRLRWPGYLGAAYGDGLRVLGVANVHRGFRSNHFNPGSKQFTREHDDAVVSAVNSTQVLQRLSSLELTDEQAEIYLNGIRAMYEIGMSKGWGVARAFAPAWAASGLQRTRQGMRRMAYVNTCCCQIPEDKKLLNASKVKSSLKDACTTRHPLSGGNSVTDVIAMLEPDIIMCSAKDAWDHLLERGVPHRILTIPFHQHRGDHWLLADVSFNGVEMPAQTHMSKWTETVRGYLMRAHALDQT